MRSLQRGMVLCGGQSRSATQGDRVGLRAGAQGPREGPSEEGTSEPKSPG